MKVGDLFLVPPGCITKEKFIAGKTAREIERILGFHAGRLSRGMIVVTLLELPELSQFDLAGYSNRPTHKVKPALDLNLDILRRTARSGWATEGFDRLAKVLPTTRHDSLLELDYQYPPGLGVPQWVTKVALRGRVAGIVNGYPDGRYVLGKSA